MKIKNPIIIPVFAFVFSLQAIVLVPQAHAGTWGEAISASFLKQMLEKVMRQIEGAMLVALKSTAVNLINSQVGQLVGGGSTGSSLVINDWKQYLYDEPEQNVQVYMEDWFAQATKGRASSASYSNPYSLASGNPTLGSYSTRLVEGAKRSIGSSYQPMDILEISPDPETALAEGDLRTLNALFSNPMNNPFGFTLAAQRYENAVREQEQQEKIVQAISHGYRSSPGLPGATVGQMVANAQDVGNKIIAAASNPGELVGGVITSLVNKTITNMIQKGIGNVQANMQREIGNVSRQISDQTRSLDSTLGPGAGFINEVRQQSNVIVKPATNPGAAIPQGTSI